MVASVGAPSSLAVRVSKEFDITLVGFSAGPKFQRLSRSRTRIRLASNERARSFYEAKKSRGIRYDFGFSRSELAPSRREAGSRKRSTSLRLLRPL